MFDINLAIIGLILSIFYSSSEIALLTANPLQIDVWEKQKRYLSNWASLILDQKKAFLSVILIGTNLSNILSTSFATLYLLRTDLIPHKLIIIPITIIILLFGEILPKSITRDYANIGLVVMSPLLRLSYILFYPAIIILNKMGGIYLNNQVNNSNQDIDKKLFYIQNAYEQINNSETIEKEQKEMISNVFDFRKSNVSEVMTPRTEVSAVSKDETLEKVLHIFIDSGHSKLPVFEKNLDNIIGVIYLYDLFQKPKNLSDVIKPVLHVPYSKPIMDMMIEFQTSRHAMAIVLDEHGGSAGIITTEDLFEELFGEFEDEFDENMDRGTKLSDGSILVNARLDWEEFNRDFGNIIPEGDYETIGGYIISEIGRIPNKGERLFLSIGQIVVKNASSRQIHQIQLYPNSMDNS